jgi:hypothetical protein
MNEVDVMKWALGALAAIVIWMWQRNEKRWDLQHECNRAQSDRMASLELKIVGDLPGKDDYAKLTLRLDSLDDKMGQIRDMVIRLEERGKTHTEG